MRLLPPKTSLAIVSFSVLVLLLATANLLRPLDFESVVDFHAAGSTATPTVDPVRVAENGRVGKLADKPTEVASIVPRAGPVKVNNADLGSGFPHLTEPRGSLDAFYRALSRTQAKQGVTRILHYGDSPVTADSISR